MKHSRIHSNFNNTLTQWLRCPIPWPSWFMQQSYLMTKLICCKRSQVLPCNDTSGENYSVYLLSVLFFTLLSNMVPTNDLPKKLTILIILLWRTQLNLAELMDLWVLLSLYMWGSEGDLEEILHLTVDGDGGSGPDGTSRRRLVGFSGYPGRLLAWSQPPLVFSISGFPGWTGYMSILLDFRYLWGLSQRRESLHSYVLYSVLHLRFHQFSIVNVYTWHRVSQEFILLHPN